MELFRIYLYAHSALGEHFRQYVHAIRFVVGLHGTQKLHPIVKYEPGLGSSTVDQVLKYTKYPKYIPSTSTGQVLIF